MVLPWDGTFEDTISRYIIALPFCQHENPHAENPPLVRFAWGPFRT